jgi:small subunit ribosomal protein S4
MGDPRKIKKKYSKPRHPWQADRIEEEKAILRNYGLRNKREIWRTEALLRGFRGQARRLLALKTEQAKKEEKQLLNRLNRLNLLKGDATLDDVLALKITDILERRLQTLVYRKGLARTMNQARQFIVHGHITVDGEKVTAPSFLVKADEEEKIEVSNFSPIKDQITEIQEAHRARKVKGPKKEKKIEEPEKEEKVEKPEKIETPKKEKEV